jgi:LysM repeat protein
MRKITALVAICVLATTVAIPSLSNAQSTPTLTNPGFEDPFVTVNASPSGQSIANGWNTWFTPRTEGAPDFENLAPEYYEATTSNRVRSGNNAQRYESFFATHNGGVFQVVEGVSPGQEVTFSIFAYVWSSGLDDENVSANDGDVVVQVGIDPNGGTDSSSGDIIWSVAKEQYDAYNQYSVSAIAEGNNVSVWVRSRVGFPVKTSQIHLDDASLDVVGDSQPNPTDTPQQPTAVPTNVPDATQAPATNPTPTVDTNAGGPSDSPTTVPTQVISPPSNDFPGTIIYTIQRGDTVSQLAQRYSSTIAAIQEANGLSTNSLIFVGQRIIIPVPLIPSTPVAVPPTMTPQVIVVTATPNTPSDGPQQPPSQGTTIYVVQPGDTLTAISQRFNTTVAAIAQLNGIVNADSILIGQNLTVPGSGTGGPAPIPNTPEPPPAQPATYVVQPGENLYRIALRFNVSLAELARANNIANANRIFAGQTLIIP